jgi:hypothetical protein
MIDNMDFPESEEEDEISDINVDLPGGNDDLAN